MRQALEALENKFLFVAGDGEALDIRANAITSLRQAITVYESAPPECQTEAEKTAFAFGWWKAMETKREWVGLTDEEIEQGCKESWVTLQAWQSAVWWAEAKLKEKNT